jgi:hypothetical protein
MWWLDSSPGRTLSICGALVEWLRFPGATADAGTVWRLALVCLSCTVAVVSASILFGERPRWVGGSLDWVDSLPFREPPSVLVLLVPDRSGVASVRAAVDPARILAETPDAIVLREGRVVATGPEAVGDPLTEAGFSDRSIELWKATQPGPREGGAGEAGGPSLAALLAKPTLTPLEVLAILNGSVSGVER